MGADLLEALEIVTELGVDTVGEDLVVLAVNNITLSVEEPCKTTSKSVLISSKSLRWKRVAISKIRNRGVRTRRNLVLSGVLDDGNDTLELLGCDKVLG